MSEFIVYKQNSFADGRWSPRVLTINPTDKTVFLSQKGHPANVAYYKVAIKSVKLWPNFDFMAAGLTSESKDARLTFQLNGYRCDHTTEDAAFFQGLRSHTSADGQESPEVGVRSPAQKVQSLGRRFNTINLSKKFTWNLRCHSRDELDALVQQLQAIII